MAHQIMDSFAALGLWSALLEASTVTIVETKCDFQYQKEATYFEL